MITVVSNEDVALVDEHLSRGEIVAIPTDTVYGVAARFEDAAAVARLFTVKGRPGTTALPVMIANPAQLTQVGVSGGWNDAARALSDSLWPGPLTIVVRASDESARRVGSTTRSIGLRMPDDVFLLGVLTRVGPLAVTSANAHGQPECHSASEVVSSFAGREELQIVVDGGHRDGTVSTVVDVMSEQWRILRQGAIPAEAIASLLG